MIDDIQRKKILLEWFENHRGLISKVLRAWGRTASDRDDLVQEIGLQLWESIPRFRQESKASTWVYRVALYAAMAWSRREGRFNDRMEDLKVIPFQEEPEEDPRVAWLYEQIAELGELDRSLTLLLLDGWTYREMADSLGMTESNVSVRIHRVKKRLAQRFEKGDSNGI